MKATKKIVGAACALVSAVALSAGATFAWFSSNGTVDATGLEIDVSTNNAYLVIAADPNDLDDGLKHISLENVGKKDGEALKLLPSSYKDVTVSGSTDENKTASVSDTTTNDPTDAKCITKMGNWYTAQGTSATNGTIETNGSGNAVVKETLSTFEGYVVITNMYVSVAGTVAVNTVEMTITDDAWKKDTGAASNNDPISLVILYRTIDKDSTKEGAATAGSTSWNRAYVDASNNHVLGNGGKLVINDKAADYTDTNPTYKALDSTQYIEIQVMVYFDGHHEDVTTMNQANLTGITLDFTFTDPSTQSGGGSSESNP